MNTTRSISILFFALTLVVLGGAKSLEETGCPCSPKQLVEGLLKDGGECQSAMVSCVLEENELSQEKAYVDVLLEFLRSGCENREACGTAAFILGESQEVQAIPVFIDLLEESFLGVLEDMPYQKDDPSSALIKIGEPSLEPLLAATSDYKSPQTRQMIGSMIYQICQSKAGALHFLETKSLQYPEAAKSLSEWVIKVNV